MHIHILGIGGTFMSALALLARDLGFIVTGSDENCYPPISYLLEENKITWTHGYVDSSDALRADCVIVGNAIKRGMPVMEDVLNHTKKYTSGPQWLAENVLNARRVIAIAGTHGKTTTTSMLSYILEKAGFDPGFLIGGVARNFDTSSKLGGGEYFVIEADEYDTAFFDKRPKFMHYRPEIAILNNLEFDHADIYPNLAAIKQQFHFLIRTIPSNGLILKPGNDFAINDVIKSGLYSNLENIGLKSDTDWYATIKDNCGSEFDVFYKSQKVAEVNWSVIGDYNVENALMAIAASNKIGISPSISSAALSEFMPVKRRLEVRGVSNGVTVYDDFAHHPTAIRRTIDALNKSKRHARVFAVMEFSSYTMREGFHEDTMAHALDGVTKAYILNPEKFAHQKMTSQWQIPYQVLDRVDDIVLNISQEVKPNDAILVMSNRGFGNIHNKLLEKIKGVDIK